jgi:hypothetical protein
MPTTYTFKYIVNQFTGNKKLLFYYVIYFLEFIVHRYMYIDICSYYVHKCSDLALQLECSKEAKFRWRPVARQMPVATALRVVYRATHPQLLCSDLCVRFFRYF